MPVLLCSEPDFEQLSNSIGDLAELHSTVVSERLDLPNTVSALVNVSSSADWDRVSARVQGIGMWRSEDVLTQDPATLHAVHHGAEAREQLASVVSSEIESMFNAPTAEVVTVRLQTSHPRIWDWR